MRRCSRAPWRGTRLPTVLCAWRLERKNENHLIPKRIPNPPDISSGRKDQSVLRTVRTEKVLWSEPQGQMLRSRRGRVSTTWGEVSVESIPPERQDVLMRKCRFQNPSAWVHLLASPPSRSGTQDTLLYLCAPTQRQMLIKPTSQGCVKTQLVNVCKKNPKLRTVAGMSQAIEKHTPICRWSVSTCYQQEFQRQKTKSVE